MTITNTEKENEKMRMRINDLSYNVYKYILKCIDIEDIEVIDSGHGIDIGVDISGKYKFETATLFNNILITNIATNTKIVLSSNSFSYISIY